ncbi:plakophilin-3 isoform X4 [Maylandia zebra]|uniref:plakophilin-3 isoform X4 n=1 Tax=Maylandia zebra TaxID=106582 RepID=UPI000D2F4EB7|nr:plakophilin-3 isoform X4 [Maylandia zebra]
MNVGIPEGCFLSALQPNSSCTAYVVPSDGPSPDPVAKARRVREQVRMRLAERKSSSLSRLEGSTAASPRLTSLLPSVFARRHPETSRRAPVVVQVRDPPEMKSYGHAQGFSSRSMINTPSRVMAVPTVPLPASGFSSRSAVDTTSRLTHKGTLRRSLSGILAQEKGCWQEEELPQQYTYKGPSHRTISRITNRQQHYQQQQSSSLGQEGWVGNGRGVPTGGDTWGTQWHHQQQQQQQHVSRTSGTIHRAASLRSLRSVGKGVDVFDGASIHSNDPLGEMQNLDMPTAVKYLSESDAHLQVVGAAFVQHQCFHSRDAKHQVRVLQGVPALVQLFSSDNQEVKRYATAATRNLIYESAENKVALIDAGGLTPLISLLNEPDEELRKTITGVLWNLSSRDNLKEKLSREALPVLTQKVLIPLCRSIPLSPSERDIFNSTTGCLRNLSSVNERTRQKMREMPSLVDSLVTYIQQEEQGDEKGLENSLCVMRNLSYQLYSELPPSVQLRLEGPSRASANREIETIGCFTLYSKKNVEQQNHQNLPTLSQPKGSEWLWHPKVVGLYKLILQNSDYSSCSREAAIGALQNITAGDARWASVLSMVIIEKERMLPILLDRLDTISDTELRPLSGLLRNLARHATDKQHMAKNMVGLLVSKLPADGLQKMPSSDVVVNLCGALNHLVTCSSSAARDVCHFNGIPKLVGIKTSHDSSSGSQKAARAASTVLCNMFQYKKLHRDYRLKGFGKRDFADGSF